MIVLQLMKLNLNNFKAAYRVIHAEGFPVLFVGRKALIVRSKVDEWLENNISKCF